MSKIQRYNGDFPPFARDFQSQERTSFGTEDVGVDNLTDNINSFWLRGWGIISPSEFPPIQYFNALGFTLSQSLAYLHQQGMPEWDAAQEYFIGSVTQKGGRVYIAQTGTDGSPNVGNDPTTNDGTNWAPMPNGKSARAEKATDSGADTFVSAVNTDVPAGDYTIRRDFQSANGTTAPTLDGKTVTTRDGSALWDGALSGVHDLQYKSGADAYRVLDPNPLEGDQPASVSYVDRKTGQASLVFATVGTKTNPGAAGDGDLSSATGTGTNDRDALAALAREIRDAGGGILDLEGKTYRVDTSDGTDVFDLADFEGVTVRNGTFDARNHTGGAGSQIDVFGGGGNIESAISLAANAGNYSRSVELASALDANDGDWLLLESDANFDIDGDNNRGELVRTSTNSNSTTIVLREAIDYSYSTSDNARVSRLDWVENIRFENIHFYGNGASEQHNAINPVRCLRVTVRDCKATLFSSRAFGFHLCAHVFVENCLTELSYDGSTNYGVVFTDGSHYGYVTGCTFHGCRHGVATGGSQTPNRHITAYGNACVGALDAAFDSHRGADHVSFIGNHANTRGGGTTMDAILVQAYRCRIIGNTITGNQSGRRGIFWQVLHNQNGPGNPTAIISDNQINGSGDYVIMVRHQGAAQISGLVIEGNSCAVDQQYDNGIAVFANTGDIYRTTIANNALSRIKNGGRSIHVECADSTRTCSRGAITGGYYENGDTTAPCVHLQANGGTIEEWAISGVNAKRGLDGIRADGTDFINIVGCITIAGVTVDGVNSNTGSNI